MVLHAALFTTYTVTFMYVSIVLATKTEEPGQYTVFYITLVLQFLVNAGSTLLIYFNVSKKESQ